CAPGSALAWGETGNKIVCYLARELLAPDKAAKLDDLVARFEVAGTRFRHYSTACAFADLARVKARAHRDAIAAGDRHDVADLEPWARFAAFNRWHALYLEREDQIVDEGDCPNVRGCVLSGIAFHSEKLKTGPTDRHPEAVILLGQWVGDVHQPLHVGFLDDLGGQAIDDVHGLYGPNRTLRAVWDNGIIAEARRVEGIGWMAYARTLLAEIGPDEKAAWAAGDPVAWARESHAIATHPETRYCLKTATACEALGRSRFLDQDYQLTNQPKVETRLKQAGVRLADMLAGLL
ncbi:MAG: S1/P1 nuclease, partial [Pseudomonadota bacterium]